MEKLLLLHGALGSASDLQLVSNALSTDFNCVSFEFPGHGITTLNQGSFNIDAFAEALGQFVVLQNLQGCKVFGYSMGGFVACKLQSQMSCFSAVYTLGTKFIWNRESEAKEAGQLNPAVLEERFPSYAQKLANQHTALGWKTLLAATATMMLNLGEEVVLSDMDLGAIGIPVAIGLGDRDKMIPLEDATATFKKFPKGCLDVLPYTQHPIDRLDLGLLRSRLQTFFNSQP